MKINTFAHSISHLIGPVLFGLVVLSLVGCGFLNEIMQAPTPTPPETANLPRNPILTPTQIASSSYKPSYDPYQSVTATSQIESSEKTATPIIPTSTQSLPVNEGYLDDLVAHLEAIAPRQATQGFKQPGADEIKDFSRLAGLLQDSRFDEAAVLAEKYDYELSLYQDSQRTDAEYIVLQEGEPIQRGWGSYVFDLQACRNAGRRMIIEAPHILADEGTPQIALGIFREVNGCALLIAGTHRDANRDGSADVAHNPATVFQSIQNGLVGSTGSAALVLQVHGFSAAKHPGYPPIVIGGTSQSVTDWTSLLSKLTQALMQQGIETGLCDGVKWTDLCGETNVQANSLEQGTFIHLELDDALRTDPGKLIAALSETFH